MSELLKMLLIAAYLGGNDSGSLIRLQAVAGGVSPATAKRYIAELRLMGADIQVLGGGRANCWRYHLANWPEICHRVGTWITLESTRSLTGPI